VTRVALIGLGEVGRIFAEDLAPRHVLAVWDVAFADRNSTASRNAAALGLPPSPDAPGAVAGARVVVSAVTAGNCVAAAGSAAPGLEPGSWFLDLNSASPGHKREAAERIEAVGGCYVEAALMSPIGPRRLGSPFLLGGPHAQRFAEVAPELGLPDVTPVSADVGRAAATKLCRSVVVKGLEALLTEALLSARRLGVERDVLDSLPNILPPADWEALAGYFISRSLEHGTRRAEEMVEAAATVSEAGLEPVMARATVTRQRWAARFGDARTAAGDGSTIALLDAVLEAAEVEL
jgi:3-hydroxyisobutyrate dehydrogenase-like beta-hydroxyacid dehydrogenase